MGAAVSHRVHVAMPRDPRTQKLTDRSRSQTVSFTCPTSASGSTSARGISRPATSAAEGNRLARVSAKGVVHAQPPTSHAAAARGAKRLKMSARVRSSSADS